MRLLSCDGIQYRNAVTGGMALNRYSLPDSVVLQYNLQFFASSEGPGGEKTEEATPKKLEDARKEGQVAKSQDLVSGAGLLVLFIILKLFVGYLGSNFVDNFTYLYNTIEEYSKEHFNASISTAYITEAMFRILLIALPFFAAAIVVAVTVNVLQVRWQPTAKPLKPKFSKINPISGFKRIISLDKLVELIKALLKIGVISYIVYSTVIDQVGLLELVYQLEMLTAVMLLGNTVINLGIKVSAVFLIIGLADYIYQKMKFSREMRMTKQEIKDEFKQSEGDPVIKGQIKRKMREASQRRMMQRLPEADVVITNPTHLACAIKYDTSVSDAPVLIAKGADYLAQKIKEVARENNVPIVENKPLARMLYHNVEIDEEIPQEMYQTVAEVLAYVYSINGKA